VRSSSILSTILLLTATSPSAAAVDFFGGRFDGLTEGYVDATYADDPSGIAFGDPVSFSAPWVFPFPQTVTFSTPVLGTIQATYTSLASFTITPAGEFFTLDGPGGFLSVNNVTPGYGIASFGLEYTYTIPVPPTPPCMNCDGPPPPIPGTPEPSTWLMMLLGFAGLGFAAMRRRSPCTAGL
jgi:PEP-CTERM motif